ncbi:splicing factor, arginine/serine-rich 19 [Megalops cyprinoides]|uniref:splicing factor, arginine/serine-rich 19 n=1 Tax=Megalops cyprinoides TaxID=118141 RepID=UPI001863C693|nr:splicing factor, arginine/serine-rich 19 [Megalops cyprinoides]
MGEEEEFDPVSAGYPKTKKEMCQREGEGAKEERKTRFRCFQGGTEFFDDHPSELGSACPIITDSFLPPDTLHGCSHQSFDSVDFDVELTAEVSVEDGSSITLLSSVFPSVRNRKSGTFSHQLPSALTWPSSSWKTKLKEQLLDSCLSAASLPFWPYDICTIPVMRRSTTTTTPPGVAEMPKTPLHSAPSASLSSPSSPSSSSSSSPLGGAATNYHHDSSGCNGGGMVTDAAGDSVSSTSAALPPSSLPLPLSANLSVHLSSASPSINSEREWENIETYDPFLPMEGEGGAAMEEDEEEGDEEEEGEKYDPFDPTGSPASEQDRGRGVESERESSADSVEDEIGNMGGMEVEEAARCEGKDAPPPDSTDPLISIHTPSPPPQHREENEQERAGRGREGKEVDSDNSEIEEGEIVVVGEKERGKERERKSERDGKGACTSGGPFLLSGPEPERILRVLDGDQFVSVRAESEWTMGGEEVGGGVADAGDLRRKLVSRRRERYRSCPSSSLSPPPTPHSHLPSLAVLSDKYKSKEHRSKEREKHKREQGREEEKAERKRRKEGGSQERKNSDKERERKSRREEKGNETVRGRSSRSDSSKRRCRHSTPKLYSHSRSRTSSLHRRHRRRSWSSSSEGQRRDRDGEKEKDRGRGDREREREGDSNRRKREKGGVNGDSGSREREGSGGKRVRRSRERLEKDKERRRDSRTVIPPSIQDLNGSDLFTIKRTITVTTTTTTTTTVPGSPPLPMAASSSSPLTSEKPRKNKRNRKRGPEEKENDKEDEQTSRSPESSFSQSRLHSYDSDQLSEKLGLEVLSLDGEALDSDYPSLEDSPLILPLTPPQPSPKHKLKSKTGKQVKTKSQLSKKSSTSESSLRPKSRKRHPPSSPPPAVSSPPPFPAPLPSKRGRKTGKEREKGAKKEGGWSGKSNKLSRGSRKAKLQSKVSVLVREGFSSTTGAAITGGSKDLPRQSGGSGGAAVGGSIAVVFRRDNESRSPFLKPHSEPISVSERGKDLSKIRRRGTLAPSPSASAQLPKSRRAKPGSTTSTTSSSASSSSSALSIAKQRRKQGKKGRECREKGRQEEEVEGGNTNCSSGAGNWGVTILDIQSGSAISDKPSSPPPRLPASTPSSSSTSIAPPSSSPPHTPPLSLPPSHDAGDSTPDSQTVDSSCKSPEASFLSEDCTTQTQTGPLAPSSDAPSSPSPLQPHQGAAVGVSQSIPGVKIPPDEQTAHTSPPSPSTLVPASLSLPLPAAATDASSSSVSSSSNSKPLPPAPPPPAAPPLPWSLQTGVDCTAGGVLALTALLFKMEEANTAGRAKAQEFIQATSQILSQANQSQPQQNPPSSSSSSSSSSSQALPLPSLAASPAQFNLHSSLPLVSSTKTPPSHLHPGLSVGGGCAQTPPPPQHVGPAGVPGGSGETGQDTESKDPEKYLKKLHTQERAVEEVKLAIKPYYQRKDINKEEYKDILRKAVHKICHSRTGEINPVKVSNLVKLYVQRYKYFRKHGRRMDEKEREGEREPAILHSST